MAVRPIALSLTAVLLAVLASGCVSGRQAVRVGAEPMGTVSRARAESTSGHATTSLVTWNVHKGRDRDFEEGIHSLLETLPAEDALILCLQEARSTTYGRIKNTDPRLVSGHYAASWRYPFCNRSSGILTVGDRSPPGSRGIRVASPHREFYLTSPKTTLITEHSLPSGKSVTIVNTHGLNFVSSRAFAKQMEEVFASLPARPAPAIICGDFNVWSPARLEILRKSAREAGMREATAEHRGGGTTAPRWLGLLKPLIGIDTTLPLDRIFHRGIRVDACYRIDHLQSSDHVPLIIRFRE